MWLGYWLLATWPLWFVLVALTLLWGLTAGLWWLVRTLM